MSTSTNTPTGNPANNRKLKPMPTFVSREHDAVLGCMAGGVMGDCLGAPFEFRRGNEPVDGEEVDEFFAEIGLEVGRQSS